MPRYAANISLLFAELPFFHRFEAAAAAGFRAVEIQFPYAIAITDISERLASNGLTLALHNLPAGNWDAGERGIACHPDRTAEFEDGVEMAIRYATALGCHQINCIAGVVPRGVEPRKAYDTLLRNLRFAARELREVGIRLLVEPINTFDIPGFYLCGSDQAVALIDEVGADNVKLQYDLYHMQRMEGVSAAAIKRLLPHIGHIQVADSPGRHEPGTGAIDFEGLLPLLDRLGYSGWVGCEWIPEAGTTDGLARIAPELGIPRGGAL